MRKFLIFSVALMTTTLLGTSCQKEEMVVTSQVTTAEKKAQTVKSLRVSYKDAIQIATDAVAMLDKGATTRSDVRRRVDLSKVRYHITPQTRSGEGSDTLYYVVNYADSAGFALVSTSRAEGDPLIAVTEQGNYTPGEETGNPGFDMYIDLLNSRIDNRPPTIDTTFHGFGPFYDYEILEENEVESMLSVRWGQWDPYNKFCDDPTYPAGCVAIALAQIMSYHQLPTAFTRTYDETNAIQILNWVGIKYSPDANYCTIENRDALAHLIREIGEIADIEYTPGRSGTLDTKAVQTLFSFGYSLSATLQGYNLNRIHTELDNNRPVYMRGSYNNDPNGHAWVVDGYYYKFERVIEYYETGVGGDKTITNETPIITSHLHINWGEHGDGNGFYNAGVFDTDNYVQLDAGVEALPNNEFNTLLQIIVGITPNI
ncbi:MAG: C10 family peptidase [Alistipes sp.]|nr:C10 family peptidase [Alistipes sp.]